MMTGVEAGLKKGKIIGISESKFIGMSEGKKIGVSLGKEIGKKENQKEIVKKMLNLKIPIEQIKEITELSEVEINQLLN